jgi:DNA-binding transcriptional ArsR family regulator
MSNLAIASVSEHLKVLRKTGLLRLEKQGRFRFFQTDRSVLTAVISALIEMSDGT